MHVQLKGIHTIHTYIFIKYIPDFQLSTPISISLTSLTRQQTNILNFQLCHPDSVLLTLLAPQQRQATIAL